ncbi:hypothetical protein NO371_23650, partial [Escherichia coli]|nr:hypothetical protein [Escherichia coli]
ELHRSFSSYITFTSLIHHFYIIPSAHTSLSSSVPFVHHPLPERADSRVFRLRRQRFTATQ